MNHDFSEKISPADPRLTAYAFGELEGDELKLIEAAVAADPALQAAVAELRGFGDTLTSALGDEVTNEKVDGDLRAPAPTATMAESKPKNRLGRIIPFPLHYFATAAAACFAVVVWMRYDTNEPLGAKRVPEEKALEVAAKPAQLSELEHRAQVARKAAAAPMASPVSDARIASTVESALPQPVMSPPPSEGASSVAGMGFGVGAGEIGTGTGFSTGMASGGVQGASQSSAPMSAQISGEKQQVADISQASRKRQMSVTVSSAWTRPSDYVFRNSDVARNESNEALGGFGQDRRNVSNEAYSLLADNVYRTAESEPLSTFSIDVDTASYSNVRRFLTGGRLPPRDAVRVEELINYFPYGYTPPADSAKNAAPFAAHLEVASAPWAPSHRLVRIGIKGRELTAATRPPANLVFLLDVSGSMNQPNKLPLVKESLRLLVERLRPDDRVAIVTYAGNSGLALPSTPASQKREILASLDGLRPGGGTNGAMGIHLAYDIAKANFADDGGINRVILCTDGDFNVGVTDRGELVRLVAEKAKSRVFLSVFGFGMGNYKDSLLESLADKGNGVYGYIDTRREAEKVFVEQVEGTLATIAKDVKIQVEFNPARVQSYRLIGYENRILAKEDFNNDAVDAGDIGAGHTVTALYEIVPVGVEDDGAARPAVDPLKYQKPSAGSRKVVASGSKELLTVKIRYKAPEGDVSAKQEFPLIDGGRRFEQTAGEFQFAAAVAAWGMLLRDSPHKGSATFDQVLAWAENGLGDDAGGYRSEFIQLVRKSAALQP